MATFQERLKELRKAHKLKQAELAEKLGVSMFTVSVWERGQRMPEFDNLEALSSVLDVNIAYLLGASDDPSPKGVPSDEDFQKWEQYSNFTRMWIPTRSLHHSIYFYQILKQ